MKLVPVLALVGMLAGSAFAQDVEVTPLDEQDSVSDEPQVSTQHVTIAPLGVVIRALDKVSGEVVDFGLEPNETKQLGRIQVTLGECRFPTLNPAGDAFAYLTIRNAGETAPVFRGWMIASSPALSALDHPRYDVWPLRCITS